MNIVKLLDITYKEDIISNLLVALINESYSFRHSFFKNILGIDITTNDNVKAFTRIITSVGIPDIIIYVNREDTSYLIIIENKLRAKEGKNQTLRYSSEKCIQEIKSNEKLNIKDEILETKFIYLTLIPEEYLSSDKFINITYKDLISKLNVTIENRVLNKIYKDLCENLNEFYNLIDVKSNYKVVDIFNEDLDKKAVFFKFREIIKNIKEINGLKIRDIDEIEAKGRFSFYAQISKDDWIGKNSIKLINEKYTVGKETYHIHLEITYDLSDNKINIFLHYEPYPYIPKKKLLSKSKEEDYELYNIKREGFKILFEDEVKKINNNEIKIAKRKNCSNLIASMILKLDDKTTIKDFKKLIEENMHILSILVDNCIDKHKML